MSPADAFDAIVAPVRGSIETAITADILNGVRVRTACVAFDAIAALLADGLIPGTGAFYDALVAVLDRNIDLSNPVWFGPIDDDVLVAACLAGVDLALAAHLDPGRNGGGS